MYPKKTMLWLKSLFLERKNRSIWLTIAISIAVVFFIRYGIVEHIVPKRFGVVEKGYIYRSGQLDSALIKRTLVDHKIDLIVSLRDDSEEDKDINAERQTAEELGIQRLVFPLKGDGTGDINNYAGAIAAICQARKEQKHVLVHCGGGEQRTSGVVAAYRLLIEKKSVPFIIAEMKHYGANLDHGSSLLPYLNNNMRKLAVLLKQMGVMNDISASLPQISPAGG